MKENESQEFYPATGYGVTQYVKVYVENVSSVQLVTCLNGKHYRFNSGLTAFSMILKQRTMDGYKQTVRAQAEEPGHPEKPDPWIQTHHDQLPLYDKGPCHLKSKLPNKVKLLPI